MPNRIKKPTTKKTKTAMFITKKQNSKDVFFRKMYDFEESSPHPDFIGPEKEKEMLLEGLENNDQITRGLCAIQLRDLIRKENETAEQNGWRYIYKKETKDKDMIDNLLARALYEPSAYIRTYSRDTLYEIAKRDSWGVRERIGILLEKIDVDDTHKSIKALTRLGRISERITYMLISEPAINIC